ncbi:MFS transporter [Prevotella sp. MGM2]|nr:MFS transporter [Prevotella sp. MGM2]
MEYQGDEAYLGKAEAEFFFYQRIAGRNYGLYHVVQQMGETYDEEYRVGCGVCSGVMLFSQMLL